MLKKIWIWQFLICLGFSNELQDAINSAKAGDIIELSSGSYYGNIIIDKPLIIDGVDQSAVIVGDGKGSIINIKSPNVTIKNLTITNSGLDHSNEDSAVIAENVHSIKVLNNRIEGVLYGVSLLKTNRSEISHNQISSVGDSIGFRGDAIKLWYSHENKVIENKISHARDMVFWYSSLNHIENNEGSDCRYSLHFMYSNNNVIRGNKFNHNSVGLFFMFSRDSIVSENVVQNADGAYGVGIGMKDSSNFTVMDNKIIYNARGLYLDWSPFIPGSVNKFDRNEISYNSVGIQFHATQEKSQFRGNVFKGNMQIVLNDTPKSKLNENEWSGNYYDEYDGFDTNKDGIGDIEYQNYAYADQLWQHKPKVRFFYGSAAMSLLNFIARLAPFSEPELLLSDKTPLTKEPR